MGTDGLIQPVWMTISPSLGIWLRVILVEIILVEIILVDCFFFFSYMLLMILMFLR